jgi:hypothetical protein
MLRTISRTIEKTSPLGLFVAGAAVAMAVPSLKQTVRSAAVSTTRGVLQMSAAGAAVGQEMRESWEDIVAEAKSRKSTMELEPAEKDTILGAGAGGAVGAGLGGNLGGGMGAVVGGGIGSVIGAGIGSSLTAYDQPKDKTEKAGMEVKEAKSTARKANPAKEEK